MQDQNTQNQDKRNLRAYTWQIIALFILIAGGIWFWSLLQQVPHSEWRNAQSPLPWKNGGVVVEEATASWQSSAGDERMELRALYYPSGRIVLESAEGKGIISARFIAPSGHQMGDRIFLPYENGKFTATSSHSIGINGNVANIRLEDGFQTQDLYQLHQINQNEPYWLIEFDCQPEGETRSNLGYISIVPHDI